MLSCKDTTLLVSESMDRTLPPGRRLAKRLHLMMCVLCARYERQLFMMREVLKRVGAEENPPGPDDVTLSPEAKERIKKALNHP
ncbi:MAG: zf-HC2 domain-containing protein [Deltaproteobacteria bacterium]|nr:zf-HC2 domain-containing protein [Deltaproteobacteria bacterium]